MKKVTIYLPDYYDRCLVVTAIGNHNNVGINVSTNAVDLNKGTEFMLETDRSLNTTWKQMKCDEEETEICKVTGLPCIRCKPGGCGSRERKAVQND